MKLVSDYHTKYIQILGGTSFVKELVPVKRIVTEATKYSVEYEWDVCLEEFDICRIVIINNTL